MSIPARLAGGPVTMAAMAVMLGAIGASAGQVSGDVHGIARQGNRPAVDAVIWLEAPEGAPPAAPRPPLTASPRVVLDQRNLTFIPHVLVVQVGTTVDFPNNDRVFHNVFSFRDGTRFDLGMYPVGALRHVVFDRPGLSRIFCNIHQNMAAYVMTVDSPHFARSDGTGAFTIADVPSGRYTYHAWLAGRTELTGTWTSTDGPLAIVWP
jgi:plastocyanin